MNPKPKKVLANTRKTPTIVQRCSKNQLLGAKDVADKACFQESLVHPTIILNVKKFNFHYPEKTTGTKQARELRERTNSISDEERKRLLDSAMERIYGPGPLKTEVGTGH